MTMLGDYRLTRKIGEGAFGCTFLAEQVRLGVPACVKIERTGREPFTSLFREEARLLWNVGHESLPTVKAYDESLDGQYLVMSYVEGENLHTHVARHGAIADEHCCWMLQRMLNALSYLHRVCRCIHGDVKPVNSILDLPNHNVTLVDFGLSVRDPRATTHAKGGTKYFLAPELTLGKPPIPASDIYALGKTAVAITGGDVATGRLPRDMHPELQRVIQSMIRHDPLARPQDARELLLTITALRQSCWDRTESTEMIAYRK